MRDAKLRLRARSAVPIKSNIKEMRRGPASGSQLAHGRTRRLTESEVNRGYLFISNATYRDDFMDDNDFTLIFDGERFPHRHLDTFGRAIVSRRFMNNYKAGTTIEIKLVTRSEIRVEII